MTVFRGLRHGALCRAGLGIGPVGEGCGVDCLFGFLVRGCRGVRWFYPFHDSPGVIVEAIGLLARWIVLIDAGDGILVLCFHDALNQRVGVDFEIGIISFCIECVSGGIAGIVGIESVSLLPHIRYAVAVGVEVSGALPGGEVLLRVTVHVADLVDKSFDARHRPGVGRFAFLGLGHIAVVHVIAEERGTSVGHDLGIGILGGVGGHLTGRSHSLVELDAHAGDTLGVVDVFHILTIGEERVLGVFLAVDDLHALVILHAFPVVVGAIDFVLAVLSVDIVSTDIVTARHVEIGLLVGGSRAVGNRDSGDAVFVFHLRRSLVVVVHHVDVAATGSSIASTCAPVEDEAVAEVDVLGLHGVVPFVCRVEGVGGVARPVVSGTIEAWSAVGYMGDHVMMETGEFAAPDAAVAVSPLVVSRIVEAFAEGAPLHGEVVVVVKGSHFVDAPRQ